MTSGGSGPVTQAGIITLANAEALSGIVLHQLKRKGAPIISGFVATTLDMRTSIFSYGSPEFRLTHAACSDLYHYYGIPVWGTAGCSDSHCFDQQAALEATATILTAAQEGANLIHDIGYLGQGLIGNPAMLVMCSEIISYAKRLNRGFDISREKIGLEAIRKVGPGGNFLAEDHTVKHFRADHWVPKFLNRRMLDNWKNKGEKPYEEVVIQKTREILETHKPEPLPENILQALQKIGQKAEKALAGQHLAA
jgi:trimethylamine--corrinoid protein Co-methyltransferase